MKQILLILLLFFCSSINAQKVTIADVYGNWSFNTSFQDDSKTTIKTKGTVTLNKNKKFTMICNANVLYNPFNGIDFKIDGTWKLVQDRLVYELETMKITNFHKSLENLVSYFTKKLKGMLETEKIEAFDSATLIVKDDTKEIVYKRIE